MDDPVKRTRKAGSKLCLIACGIGMFAHVMCVGAAESRAVGGIVDAAMSPDGKTLAAACGDRSIRLWDTTSGELRRTLRGHSICASAVDYHAGTGRLASGGWDGRVILWNSKTGSITAQSTPSAKIVHSLKWIDDGKHLVAICSDGKDRHARVLDAETLEPVREGEAIKTKQLVLSPDGTRMATVNAIKEIGKPRRLEIAVADTVTGKVVREMPVPWDKVASLAFSPDARRLVVDFGGGMAAFDAGSGERVWTKARGKGEPRLRTLTVSPDGKRLAGFSRRPPIAFVDAANGDLWIGAEHAEKLAANEKAAAEAEENDNEAFVPWRPFKGLQSGWLRFSADGDSVYTVGRGAFAPQAWNIHTAESTVTFAVPEREPRERAALTKADIAFEERFDGAMDKDVYSLVAERDSLFWVGREPQNGLHFNIRGDIKDLMARDYLQREWPVGTRPFEVSCEYVMPVNKAWQAAAGHAGWWIGLSSGPVEALGDDDVTVLLNVNPKGFFAGVLGGQPFEYHYPSDEVLARSLMTPSGLTLGTQSTAELTVATGEPPTAARYEVLGHRVQLHGAAGRREIERTLRISRSADDVLVFAVHAGRRLQNEKPLWSVRWKLPERLANVPLDHLVVKRVPIPNHHPIWAMQGRITNIQATLDPPFCREFAYVEGHDVLKRDAVIEVMGSGFDPDCRVEVGGQAAGVAFVDTGKLRVTLPDLAEGRMYDLCVINPNERWSFLPDALPFGRMLTGVEPFESLPAGGREVEVVGAGFTANTEILFGETAVTVSEVLSPTRAKVVVPAGDEGPVTVKARTGKIEHAGAAEFGYAAHPYLFYTEETLPDLRKKFNDPFYAAYKKGILARGRAAPVVDGHGGAKNLLPLVGAWICTGEDRYKDKALLLVDRIIASLDQITYGRWQLFSATDVAIAYDALFAELSQKQRHGLQEYMRRSIAVHMAGMPEENRDDGGRSKPREDWYYTNISNTNGDCNGGAGMACLALRNALAMARKDLQYAIKHIRKWADQCIQPDGANVEGAFYAIVGAKGYFPFAEALAHAANDTQLLDMPNLEHHATWWKNMLGGNGRMYMFNDAYPHFGSSSMFESLARHYDQDFMRWMATRYGDRGLFGLLFRDDTPAPEQFPPPIPTLHVFESKSIATLRSEPALDAGLTICVKGNDGPDGHHNHTDIGHMLMVLNGELILSDDGYLHPSHPRNHSILFIDDEPPAGTGGWITDSWENGPWRAVVMDMRVAYMGLAQRIRRHYVMYDDKALVLLDDVVPDEDLEEGIVTSYFQAGGSVELGEDGNSAVIRGRKARLCLRSDGPGIAFETGGGGGAEGTIRNPIWGSYEANPDNPMITTMLAAPAGDDDIPKAKITRTDGAIAVAFPDGQTVLFRKTENGWAFITKDDDPRPLLSKPKRNTEIPEGAKITKAGFFKTPPRIDGLLNDAAWKDCEVIYDFKIVTGELPADHPTQVRIGYDAKNLYLAVTCLEKNLPGVVADVTERDGPCNLDDSVEIFLDTDLDRKTYFQFMINANGVLYDGFGWNKRWDAEGIEVKTGLSPKKDAWVLEIAVPWETLELESPEGKPLPMGLQIVRNHFKPRELTQWAPTGTYNNHMPWTYGVLVFE